MIEKKTSILALLRILEENTDENHIISQPKLLEMIENQYGVPLDRRTLYKNIEMLQDFGYDISTYSENGEGYYLRERQFEPSQIYLLCNAIHSSTFIPSNSSKELINKLLKTQSKFFKNDYRNAVYVDNSNKKENKEFFLNIEILSEAIKKRKSITYMYTKYDFNKNLVNKREEAYTISPHYLVYMNGKTYLVGKNYYFDGLTHLRVDKMKNIKFSDKEYLTLKKNEDPYEYAKNKIYMYGGNDERVYIKCDNCILDDVIDTFGKDIRLEKNDDNTFYAYVKSSKQGMVYLALQYLNHMEVIEPADIREEVKQALKDGQKKYK